MTNWAQRTKAHFLIKRQKPTDETDKTPPSFTATHENRTAKTDETPLSSVLSVGFGRLAEKSMSSQVVQATHENRTAKTDETPSTGHEWPHGRDWSTREVEVFNARMTRFTAKGFGLIEGESLAQKLLNRDRDFDDRRLCIECGNRTMAGQCRTGQVAGVAVEGRGQLADIRAIQTKLQRCDGFKGVVS